MMEFTSCRRVGELDHEGKRSMAWGGGTRRCGGLERAGAVAWYGMVPAEDLCMDTGTLPSGCAARHGICSVPQQTRTMWHLLALCLGPEVKLAEGDMSDV